MDAYLIPANELHQIVYRHFVWVCVSIVSAITELLDILPGVIHNIKIKVFSSVRGDKIHNLIHCHIFQPFPCTITDVAVLLHKLICEVYVLLVFQFQRTGKIFFRHIVCGGKIPLLPVVRNPYLYVICPVWFLLVGIYFRFECSHIYNLCRTFVELCTAKIGFFCCKCGKEKAHPC